MLRTGYYKHMPLDKLGEDYKRIQLKTMLIKKPVPTP